MGQEFADKAAKSQPHPYLDELKYQAEDKASEYRSMKNSGMSSHHAIKSPAVNNLPAHRTMNKEPAGPPRSNAQGFKIYKRPQSANIKPARHAERSMEQIMVVDSKPKATKQKKLSGAQADDNLLYKTKMYVSSN